MFMTKMRRLRRRAVDAVVGIASLALIVAMGFRAAGKADAAYTPVPVAALTNISNAATATGPGNTMSNHWAVTSSKSGVFLIHVQATAQVLDVSDSTRKYFILAVLQDLQNTVGYAERREPPLGSQDIETFAYVKVNPGSTFDLLARLTGPQMSVAKFKLVVVEF